MGLDRVYVLFGLAFGILGMVLGIQMSATHNHGQMVTHAHILLVGFVLSFVYAVIYRLWIPGPSKVFAVLQLLSHLIGTSMLITALFLLFGGFVPAENLEFILAFSSIIVLLSLVMMVVLTITAFVRSRAVGADTFSTV